MCFLLLVGGRCGGFWFFGVYRRVDFFSGGIRVVSFLLFRLI